MSARERIRRYKESGGAAGLIRVEVLVPPEAREQVIAVAARLRREHRLAKAMRSVNAEAVNDRAKLMIHRLLARRIAGDRQIVERARSLVSRARDGSDLDEWRVLLSRDPETVRRTIVERSDRMDRLRISSPLALVADLGDPALRRRIWRKARRGLALRAA